VRSRLLRQVLQTTQVDGLSETGRLWPNPDGRRAALDGSLRVKSGHLGARGPEKLKHSPSTVTHIVQFQ